MVGAGLALCKAVTRVTALNGQLQRVTRDWATLQQQLIPLKEQRWHWIPHITSMQPAQHFELGQAPFRAVYRPRWCQETVQQNLPETCNKAVGGECQEPQPQEA